MKRALALHWEMRPRGTKNRRTPTVVEQGPGDTLRLIHSINEWHCLGKIDAVDILTLSDPAKVAGLLPNATRLGVRWLQVKAPKGRVKLNALINHGQRQHNLRPGQYTEGIIHAYIGTRLAGTVKTPFGSGTLLRQRMDLAFCDSVTLDLPIQRRAKRQQRTLAVFFRDLKLRPLRNSPDWLVDVVREAITNTNSENDDGWCVEYCGLADEDEARRFQLDPCSDSVSYYRDSRGRGRSFLDQIEALTSFHAAVGVNSGGLDLACVAGLPILRIGEFQGGGPSEEPEKKELDWGPRYNAFLAKAANIGLRPPHEDLKKSSREVVRQSLECLLGGVDRLPKSGHFILPAGKALGDIPVDSLGDYLTTSGHTPP